MTHDHVPTRGPTQPTRIAAGGPEPLGSIFVDGKPDCTRLVLAGELDMTMNDDLNEVATTAQRRGRPVEVDTRQVTFMDSAVIAMLARLAQTVPRPLRVVAPPEGVQFLLEVAGMDRMIEIVDQQTGGAEGNGAAASQ